jgi:AcrR family transcriptional regulator
MTRSIWSVVPRPPAASGTAGRSGAPGAAPARPALTRERLLDAAAVLFYEHGFHAVGLDRILAEVGVTKTTFYNHFESKDALVVAVLEDRDALDLQALRDELARAGSDARERLLLVFDVLDAWFRDEGFQGCLFINAAAQYPNPNDPVHVAALRHGENLGRLLAELAREAGAAEPEVLARQLGLLVAAAISARHLGLDPDAARTSRRMAEVLVDAAVGARAERPA